MQVVTKDGRIICVARSPYPPETVRDLKRDGYTVREMPDSADPREALKRNRGGKTK